MGVGPKARAAAWSAGVCQAIKAQVGPQKRAWGLRSMLQLEALHGVHMECTWSAHGCGGWKSACTLRVPFTPSSKADAHTGLGSWETCSFHHVWVVGSGRYVLSLNSSRTYLDHLFLPLYREIDHNSSASFSFALH